MFSPKTLAKASAFVESAKSNKDAVDLFNRFTACHTPQEAYNELRKLSDYDYKIIAALIARANA